MAISPMLGLKVLFGAGMGYLVALRVYGGVTAPEIPSDKLREIARIFNRLADDLDGGRGENADKGIADRADALAASVWGNERNSGPAVEGFRTLYQGAVSGYAPLLAKDCRVVAIGCEAYADLVDDAHKGLAQLEDLILQIMWVVTFQPMTTALYGVAAARVAALIRTAKNLKSAFALNAARIMEMTVPKYTMTTLLYMAIDGAAYAAGSMAITKSVQLSHGLPLGSVGENAEEFGKIVGANSAYVVGYDLAKLPARGVPTTRGIELGARLTGSGLGYTPAYSALDGDGELLPTYDEWAAKFGGHGLRAVIFPPGWKFK
ncbi:hypothetical protein [Streptosporangium minutum]|uniref:Uncharacterized protein n=1 Tax=Streptosporangium minutum TaxID=569862 RepID=A0A243QVH5_9ACTN|nr:hypothetical protein [Streptosporangium minutum]OUC86164.1 hypothetical protein CA984_38815 [Streptosporangium minutum]